MTLTKTLSKPLVKTLGVTLSQTLGETVSRLSKTTFFYAGCLQENADNVDIDDYIREETQAVADEKPAPDVENNDRDKNEGRTKRDYFTASLQ